MSSLNHADARKELEVAMIKISDAARKDVIEFGASAMRNKHCPLTPQEAAEAAREFAIHEALESLTNDQSGQHSARGIAAMVRSRAMAEFSNQMGSVYSRKRWAAEIKSKFES